MRIRTPADLGALIRDSRTKLGLDQKSLAEKVGVSRQWIVEIEKGKFVLYYATPETVDTYHGRITLIPQQVDMRTFQSGDLISVHGHLASRADGLQPLPGPQSLVA